MFYIFFLHIIIKMFMEYLWQKIICQLQAKHLFHIKMLDMAIYEKLNSKF